MRVRTAFPKPALSGRQRSVLAMVALASLVTSYGAAIMVFALPQIQDGLSIEDAAVSDVAATIRLGSLLAVPIVLVADRIGRRPALLFVIAANAILTAATGASPSIETFVVLQFFARMLHTATGILAAVYIAEEFPSDHRGWGFGALALLSGVGSRTGAPYVRHDRPVTFWLEESLLPWNHRIDSVPATSPAATRNAAVPEC